MWDERHGGFYEMVDRTYTYLVTQSQCHIQNHTEYLKSIAKSHRIQSAERVTHLEEEESQLKTAYGNAFAIYGLSAYARVSGDQDALNLAKKTFFWLNRHSFDPLYHGYFQFLRRRDQFSGNECSLSDMIDDQQEWKRS